MFLLKYIFKNKYLLLFLILVIILVVYLLKSCFNNISKSSVSIEENTKIDLTPTQIQSIEEIGEWQFLELHDEEMIDTIRRGFFGDSRLIRIYEGTLRLGINLKQAMPGWISQHGDSIAIQLPPIHLLDNDFIDEARTRSFYESGKWDEAAKKAMYQKAYRKMKQRCLTKANLQLAEDNAQEQLKKLILGLGFKKVGFAKSSSKTLQ